WGVEDEAGHGASRERYDVTPQRDIGWSGGWCGNVTPQRDIGPTGRLTRGLARMVPMPALALPAEPTFTTDSERAVWERLVRTLPDDAVVLANLRLTDEGKDHELDLVAPVPDVGL